MALRLLAQAASGPSGSLPALVRLSRSVTSSSTAQQAAQPQVAEQHDVQDSLPRWQRELGVVRNDWTREEVTEVYSTPLLDLVYKAATVHRMYSDPAMVQRCTLLSIKTGGCPENCSYCSQSSHWSEDTGLKAEKLLGLEEVYEAAVRAREAGSTRFCMGAAWRGPSQVGPRQWERVLEMVRRIRGLGMEVCTTLGMVTPDQARDLRSAGLTAYNHNLDTSPEYYGKITTTRKYEDRLATLEAVRDAGISVCAGGIIGLGEGEEDRVGLLLQLATLPAHPESVPINRLVAVKGTPLQDMASPSGLDLVRCVATARVVMPRTVVRLSAGRLELTESDQALAFMAGANSIFDGDKLLTTPNNDRNEDERMFELLGLKSRPAFLPYDAGNDSSRSFDAPAPPAASAAAAAPAEGDACCGGGCGSGKRQQAAAV
ncbi:biotin synthase [Raphidocelis subcapitata]|uniref:biotin synthase n=1 Tax=Raphidocelis subcapitata TaxID=307507 RepID=A0A2V0PBL4_9CHLO|nr:biotin synthase [Raphidocelis subcapitata]|eukprot:GBF97251.1 biotin synthase [Raphidocelis subcapitata]